MDRHTSVERRQRDGHQELDQLKAQLALAVQHHRIQGDWVFAEQRRAGDPLIAFAHVAARGAQEGALSQDLIGLLTVTWEEQSPEHPARWYCDLFGKTAILDVPREHLLFVLRYAEHWALQAGHWL